MAARHIVSILACVLLAAAISCSGSARQLGASTGAGKQQPAAPVVEVPGSAEEVRSTLSTSLPSLAGLKVGTEFEFVLRANLTEPVFQGSARVLFDPRVVQPVSAAQGQLLPAGELVVLRHDAAPGTLRLSPVDRPYGFDGCVPFAFTGRPGGVSLTPGGGELLRIRFRLLTADPEGIPVRLQNDPQYLQLRDSRGQRVPFDLDRQAGAR